MMTTIPDFVQLWPSICLSSHCWFLQVTFGRNWSKKMTKTLFSSICYHINLRIINMIRQYCINLFTLLVHVFGCSAGFLGNECTKCKPYYFLFFYYPYLRHWRGAKKYILTFPISFGTKSENICGGVTREPPQKTLSFRFFTNDDSVFHLPGSRLGDATYWPLYMMTLLESPCLTTTRSGTLLSALSEPNLWTQSWSKWQPTQQCTY